MVLITLVDFCKRFICSAASWTQTEYKVDLSETESSRAMRCFNAMQLAVMALVCWNAKVQGLHMAAVQRPNKHSSRLQMVPMQQQQRQSTRCHAAIEEEETFNVPGSKTEGDKPPRLSLEDDDVSAADSLINDSSQQSLRLAYHSQLCLVHCMHHLTSRMH